MHGARPVGRPEELDDGVAVLLERDRCAPRLAHLVHGLLGRPDERQVAAAHARGVDERVDDLGLVGVHPERAHDLLTLFAADRHVLSECRGIGVLPDAACPQTGTHDAQGTDDGFDCPREHRSLDGVLELALQEAVVLVGGQVLRDGVVEKRVVERGQQVAETTSVGLERDGVRDGPGGHGLDALGADLKRTPRHRKPDGPGALSRGGRNDRFFAQGRRGGHAASSQSRGLCRELHTLGGCSEGKVNLGHGFQDRAWDRIGVTTPRLDAKRCLAFVVADQATRAVVQALRDRIGHAPDAARYGLDEIGRISPEAHVVLCDTRGGLRRKPLHRRRRRLHDRVPPLVERVPELVKILNLGHCVPPSPISSRFTRRMSTTSSGLMLRFNASM